LLLDEVLNFVNRHRGMADGFHAFIQNLTVAVAGTTKAAAMISLPRSQVEMSEWDQQWQDRITKIVRRVAKDLIANDESEISEVVRRRLFEDIGEERTRKKVAKEYADWCFERTARLPSECSCVVGSRPAIRFTPPPFLCSNGSGAHSRNSSKRAARSPCWLSGFPGRRGSISIKPAASH
jgi:hypothetical protein